MRCSALTLLLVFGTVPVLGGGFRSIMTYNLTKQDPSAVCLDGSPGVMYVRLSPGDPQQAKWIISFEGGGLSNAAAFVAYVSHRPCCSCAGWCYDDVDCWKRSKTVLGTSRGSLSTATKLLDFKGPLSDDCKLNPTLCLYNMVTLKYCDGSRLKESKWSAIPLPC